MRTQSAAEQIISVMHVRYPVAQRLADCILQCTSARGNTNDFGAEQSHSKDVQRLSPHIFRTHVNDATQSEQRANRRGCHAVLTCPSLSNHALLSQSACKQCLSYSV